MGSVAEEHKFGGVQAGQSELNLECSPQCMMPLEGIDAHVKILLRKAIAFLSSPSTPNCCPGVLQAQKSEA